MPRNNVIEENKGVVERLVDECMKKIQHSDYFPLFTVFIALIQYLVIRSIVA